MGGLLVCHENGLNDSEISLLIRYLHSFSYDGKAGKRKIIPSGENSMKERRHKTY